MDNYKRKLSRRLSSRKKLGSLKTKFKRFISDHQAKAWEGEDISSNVGSDTDIEGRKIASVPESGEISKTSRSGSSSESDEESSSKLETKRSEPSLKLSGEMRKGKKTVQLHPQHEREDLFDLPPLEETPPTSPQSNPRFSTGGLSDYGRLWKHASAPNSPANLAHNLNLNYRGGDASPMALVHSMSTRDRGKLPSQLAEISYASPLSSTSLDLDVLGEKLDDMKASPSKTTPTLKPTELPIVHHDQEQGVWRCGSCGWIYPNPNPSLRNRREHKKHCGDISNVQRWLGTQGVQDAPQKGAVKLEENSENLEGPRLQGTVSAADQLSMGKFNGEGDNRPVSDSSADHHGSMDYGRLDETEVEGKPDDDAVGNEDNGGSSPGPVASPHNVEDQKSNSVLEIPTRDAEMKEQSSEDGTSPKGSTSEPDVEDHSNLEDTSSTKSSSSLRNEESSASDDSPSLMSHEAEFENEEPVAVDPDREGLTGTAEPSQIVDSEVEAQQSQPNQKSREETASEAGDLQEQPENGNREPVEVDADWEGRTSTSGRSQVFDSDGEAEEGQVKQNSQEKLANEAGELQEQPGDVDGEPVEVDADREGLVGSTEPSQMFESEVEVQESQLKQNSEKEIVNDAGHLQEQPENGNEKHSFVVADSSGQDFRQEDSNAGFREGDENIHQDVDDHLNCPDDVGLTEVAELRSAQSHQTGESDAGDGNPPDLDYQRSDDAEFSKEAVVDKAVEETESKVMTHKGRPIVKADVLPDSLVTEPSLSGTDLQSVEPEIEKRDVKALKAVARQGTDAGKVIPNLTEPASRSEETQENGKASTVEISDRSSQQNEPDSHNVEGNSTKVLPSQENGNRTESGGSVAGPPSPLEVAPKWVNSGALTSQDEGDTFTSVQKYWADVTRSEFLLVEGKRSPSLGSCDNIGFPSFRNGEGRRSPSPFSLSKSQDEIDSIDFRSTVEDTEKESTSPSLAVVHHSGSSSSSAHVDYDLEKVVHEQNTHDLVCPVCGSDVTKRIILRKRKRTRVQEDDEVEIVQTGSPVGDQRPEVDGTDDETWGCLACLSFFMRRGDGGPVTKPSVSGAAEEGEPAEIERERVRCLPTLFRWGHEKIDPELQAPLLGDTASEEVVGESSKPSPLITGPVQLPLIDDEEASCFSYLQRPRTSDTSKEETAQIAKPMPVSIGNSDESLTDENERINCFSYLQRFKPGPPVKGEVLEESSVSTSQAEIENEVLNDNGQVERVGEQHGDVLPAKNQDAIEIPDGGLQQIETVETEKCECLPFFSFRSDSSSSVTTATDTGSNTRDFPRLENPKEEATSEILPESVPAFPWGTPSTYLPPSPDVSSSHQESSSAIDGPEEVPTSEEKISCNCLPELLPPFAWGRIPVYTHPTLDTDVAAEIEQFQEPTASSHTALSSPALEDAEERKSSNCLPGLLPDLSWGAMPVYSHSPLPAEIEQQKGATPVSASASVTQERQPLVDSEEKESSNRLPGLLPDFSWTAIPESSHPPLDIVQSTEIEQQQEATPVSDSPSLTLERQPVPDSEEKGTYNCLPELPPFSWGAIPVYIHPPPDTYEFAEQEEGEEHSAGSPVSSEIVREKGSCNCLPDVLRTFPWGSNQVNDEVPKDDSEHAPSSHLQAESQTTAATCACLPLLLPAFHWRFRRTTHATGLQEPLISQDPPATGPVQSDNTSNDTMQPTDPVMHGSKEGLAVKPARSVTADPPSSTKVGEESEITESKEIHMAGSVAIQETVTRREPSEKPGEVQSSVNGREFNVHFAVDIENGHVTASAQATRPKLPYTSADAPSLLAGSTDEPRQALVGSGHEANEDLDEFKEIVDVLLDHVGKTDMVASLDAVSQPFGTPSITTSAGEEVKPPVENELKHEEASCECLPLSVPTLGFWRPSRASTAGEAPEAHLLGQAERAPDASHAVHRPIKAADGDLPGGRPAADETRDRCDCLPSWPRHSLYHVFKYRPATPGTEVDDTRIPLLPPHTLVAIDTTDTSTGAEGATSAVAAADAVAIAQGQSLSRDERAPSEYLKSIVHGGLDVTLVSLGVVASGAGSEAKTSIVLAMGLANLVFGLVKHFSTITSLFYTNMPRFQEEIGQGFIHGCLSFISFLFFGAFPPVTYGFSFRHASNKNYKFASTCVAAMVALALLGAAKARVKSESAVAVVSVLFVTGFLASIAGYGTGNLVEQLLELLEFSSV